MIRHSRLLSAASVLGGAALLLTPTVDRAAAPEPWRVRVSSALQSVHDAQQAARGAAAAAASSGARLDALGRVEADVYHACGSAAPAEALAAAGFTLRGRAELPPLCVLEGWVRPEALPALAGIVGVTRVTLPSYVRHVPRPVVHAGTSTGTIDANGVHIIRADQFQAQAGGGGHGVTVGVQSSGIENLSTIQARGELPANIPDYTAAAGGTTSSGDDEGTMLLEEVHAVAPDAQLAFCEPQTFVEYTACLQQFVQAGVTVALDDEQFLDQDPMNSAGTATAALSQFLAANPNLAFFTSAGNDYGSYWQGNYTPVSVASQGITLPTVAGSSCTPATDQYVMQFTDVNGAAQSQILTTPVSNGVGGVPFTFAWGDPPGTNTSSFDVYIVNPGYDSSCFSTSGLTSAVLTQYITIPPGNNTVYIATADASLAGKFLKLWAGGDGLSFLSVSTVGSSISPQTLATGAITVGAVNGSDGVGNSIESFSSRGPITVLYPQQATIQAPTLVAPDGISVDVAGTDFAGNLFPDGNFYGTSAAVPNAAAAAALLRGAFPQLTVPQMLAALQAGAAQLGSGVPDGTYGYGRVDIIGAVDTFPAPTMTSLTPVSIDASVSTTSSSQPFSVTGFGQVHLTVTSSNAALVPAQVAAAGQPGVNVSPADCGSTTLSCTLTVTAAPYQGGMATVTVAATDGAGRQAPATLQVTVSNPQANPNPPPAASGGGGGGGGGGAMDLWALLVLSGLALHRVRKTAAEQAN